MKQFLLALAVALCACAPAEAQIVGAPQNITVVDSGTACVTAPTACAIYALDNQTGGVTFSVSGTWTGTLTFEGTNNDGSWTSLLATNVASGAQATTTTANGLFTVTNVGVIKVRLRATAAITGTANITAAKGLGFARLSGAVNTLTMAVGGKYGFAGVGNALALNGTATALQASDGGNYFYVGVATVTANAADVILANGGTPFVTFPLPTANGLLPITKGDKSIGSTIKVDALPTVGSGFGTSPSVTAGSTPFAGSVNVGTGGAATTGVITFGGTAFPSAPFCTYSTTTTNGVTRGTPTTTQLTLNSTTAWTASDIVSWHCISAK